MTVKNKRCHANLTLGCSMDALEPSDANNKSATYLDIPQRFILGIFLQIF